MDNEMKEFLKQNANFAIVVNCNLMAIGQIKHFLADEGIHIIYQRTSLSKLLIKEEKYG